MQLADIELKEIPEETEEQSYSILTTEFRDDQYPNKEVCIDDEKNPFAYWICEIIFKSSKRILVRVVDENKWQDGTAMYYINKSVFAELGLNKQCKVGDRYIWTFYKDINNKCTSRMTHFKGKYIPQNLINEMFAVDLDRQKERIVAFVKKSDE